MEGAGENECVWLREFDRKCAQLCFWKKNEKKHAEWVLSK